MWKHDVIQGKLDASKYIFLILVLVVTQLGMIE